ncbi:MAG: TetR/AcrR family transcriptional regulator [Porticoccaceae bacterium]
MNHAKASASSSEGALSREQILAAAEDVFRRFGPAKTTVVDIARLLGMSHGSVYRHFESKAALRNAVIEVWLQRYADSLIVITSQPGSARERLRAWLETLRSMKIEKFKKETELFATYHDLVKDSEPVVANYRSQLAAQVETILHSGIASGEFAIRDPRAKANAILDATTRFHHPWHAADWQKRNVDEAFQGVWELVLGDILVRPTAPPG